MPRIPQQQQQLLLLLLQDAAWHGYNLGLYRCQMRTILDTPGGESHAYLQLARLNWHRISFIRFAFAT
jgi:hypothetical protein